MVDLLRRAWDALDTFKQTYPENWHEEDEQVLEDLMKADLKRSGVEPRNFCPRCGKRTADLTVIHTCTPPRGLEMT